MNQNERLAKAAAIIMGVLLVGSIVVFLILMLTRSPFERLDEAGDAEPMDEIVVTDAPVDLGNLDIAIPAGGKVVSLEATRFEILVLIDTPQGQQGLVMDRNSGTVLARLRFNPDAP
ncbi:MAG: hypothetical protein ACE363_13045 [Alphaproteobacteria bacterium]